MMKSIIRFLICASSLITLGREGLAQTSAQFRPALLGHHTKSLINIIDTQGLMKRGQGDGFVMFGCAVSQYGSGYWSRTYRASPNTELLQKEVLGRINEAMFEPAIYKGSRAPVYLTGSVVFAVRDGKPHLRIFLHQEEEELKKGTDFVAPQWAFDAPGNPKFQGVFYPPSAPGRAGVASLKVTVNESGQVQAANVVYEYPPGAGFGKEALAIRDAAFIPGYRNGKMVSCSFLWTLVFTGPGRQMRTG
jgi:hypothetical protein